MSTEDTQPIKRGPGRPRKVAAAPKVDVPTDAWKNAEQQPPDKRIGQPVGDERVSAVTFPDGSEYRCVDGVIVERLR